MTHFKYFNLDKSVACIETLFLECIVQFFESIDSDLSNLNTISLRPLRKLDSQVCSTDLHLAMMPSQVVTPS